MFSLLFNPFSGFLSFFLAFDLVRNGADFDPSQVGCEIGVEAEGIIRADIPRRRVLLYYFKFRTRE